MPHLETNPVLMTTLMLLGLVLLVCVCQRVSIALYKRLTRKFVDRVDVRFASFFTDPHLIFWTSFLPTPIYLYFGIYSVPGLDGHIADVLQRFVVAFLIFAGLRSLANFLRIADVVYRKYPLAASRPIKGYLQTLSIVAHGMGFVTMVAVLLDKSPMVFLTGMSALSAILLLVFRDSILSLVAGIQITTNDLIRVGDWIEMAQFNADGDVVDIALHSVKVQNWDKTVTVIPAHKFLESSFKNWRGMHESGGRRIKRAVHIDVQSIRFLEPEDIERFRKYHLLREYIDNKIREITEHNLKVDEAERHFAVNTRRLTNVGTFRNYLAFYLKNNPRIHQSLTFLVRQLEPAATGLPIEIYVFTNDTRWAVYEEVQADIFDHVLAILPEFGLRFFQNPSGGDFHRLIAGFESPTPTPEPAAGASAGGGTGAKWRADDHAVARMDL